MSLLGFPAGLAAAKSTGYQIGQSLRFNDNDSAHLSRTPSTAGNRQTWTYSGWIKRGRVGYRQQLLNSTSGAYIEFVADNTIRLEEYTGSVQWTLKTNAVYRDNSAWYHIVVAFNSTESTSSNRIKLWINSEQVTSFSGSSYPALNHNSQMNTTSEHRIGEYYTGSSEYFDGYMAEVNFIDGSALGPDSFGKYDANGVWTPVGYAGSYTGNSFYLKFASGDGTDSSGLSNTWTANNFTTSGTGTDVMSDTPTNNYATLNPVDNASGATLANGNLETTSGAASYKSNFGTMFASSGKWYAEFTVLAGSNDSRMIPGVGTKQTSVTTNLGNDTYSYSINYDSGTSTIYKRTNNATTALTSTGNLTTNSVVMIALDLDNNKLWFGQDGTWFDSGAPASGTNQIFSIAAGEYTFMPCTYSDGKFAINFGQRAFAYTPPTGFKALNTSNLPAPTVKDGSDYFNTILYSGDESSPRALTGVGFQPDFVWIKCRNLTADHNLNDAVRGTGNVLATNKTDSENNAYGYVSAFSSDGFSISDGGTGNGEVNSGSGTYVAWNWLAGNGTSSNTNGTITSTVSANPTAGFSIVSYSGNNNSSATVGHGLGVSPDLVIVKDRSTSNYVWMVKFAILGGNILQLDGAGAANAPSSYSTGTIGTLTSTTFGFTTGGSLQAVNNTGQNYIAYCFAEVEGYSKMGTYTGSTGFPFVYCGFRPAFILLKPYDLASGWYMYDSTRGEYNVVSMRVLADTSDQETSAAGNDIDILSNGFKLRGASNSGSNYNGKNYIFYAVAENPFGGSGVSPATAR